MAATTKIVSSGKCDVDCGSSGYSTATQQTRTTMMAASSWLTTTRPHGDRRRQSRRTTCTVAAERRRPGRRRYYAPEAAAASVLFLAALFLIVPFAIVQRQDRQAVLPCVESFTTTTTSTSSTFSSQNGGAIIPRRRLSLALKESVQQKRLETSEDDEKKIREDSTSTRIVVELPDYGKTSVEIDKIKLVDKTKRWRRQDLFGSSLVNDTLQEMESDVDFQETSKRYAKLGPEIVTKEERALRRRALDNLGVPSFAKVVQEKTKSNILVRKQPKVLQLNIGLYCNQACSHCHVESSPLRVNEMMSAETASQCLQLLKSTPSIATLDVTGGAPELNDNFRYLVRTARAIRGPDDLEIIDRCNLSVLQEPGQEDLVDFLKDNNVRIVASLPCYSQENVDEQRGRGVFERSIAALLALNEAGYGVPGTGLVLDLVYNPLGAFLPPEQKKLEVQYKQQLADNFGILFNSLFTMTNMPIKRFADFLHRRNELSEYMDLLVRNFNPDSTQNLMCLDTISVDWTGKLYDCDFNQQLGYALGSTGIHRGGITVFDVDNLSNDLVKYKIRTDNHCFGCTAGMGSS